MVILFGGMVYQCFIYIYIYHLYTTYIPPIIFIDLPIEKISVFPPSLTKLSAEPWSERKSCVQRKTIWRILSHAFYNVGPQ